MCRYLCFLIEGLAYSRQGLVLQGSVFCSSWFIGWCFRSRVQELKSKTQTFQEDGSLPNYWTPI